MKRGSRAVARSVLFDQAWRLAGSRVTVIRATTAELGGLDRAWAPHRDVDTQHWTWVGITREHADHFAVLVDGEVVALWAATDVVSTSPPAYVLQFLEVAPAARGRGLWGAMALDLVCARAVELGADRVVLGALPNRVAWYRRWGAVDGAPGWSAEAGLAPMSIGAQVLLRASERLDGIREEEGES